MIVKPDMPTDKQKAIIGMDATQIAAEIKNKKMTPSEAVKAYTEHITRVNPHINAMVETRFAEAGEEAKEKERTQDSSKQGGKLGGVPISVKESFDVQGMKTTSGLLNRKDMMPDEDAEI